MNFSRGQTQVLYQFLPGAVFEHDQYGFCLVTNVELQETNVNQDALFTAMSELLLLWPEPFRSGFADPRIGTSRKGYVIGSPSLVKFKPYPTLLECRSCRRVYRVRDLQRRANTQPHRCPNCQGVLGQLRYIQAHNCGRIEELYYPSPACKVHGTDYLTFLDTGRVRSARWRCGACGNAEIGRLRMTPCTCQYSRSLPTGHNSQYEKGLKTLPLTDSALFLPSIVSFINFSEENEQFLKSDPDIYLLALARSWGIIDEPLPEIIKLRNKNTNIDNVQASATIELLSALKKADPNNPLIQQWEQSNRDLTSRSDEIALQRVKLLLGDSINSYMPRQLIENIAIIDTLHTTSIEEICKWMDNLGDTDGTQKLCQAEIFAHTMLGINRMFIINDFPIALCAVGYTRITRDPARSILSPFESNDPQGRTPLYAVSAETEGIYLQLDPLRVIQWLIANAWISGPSPKLHDEAWTWLYLNVPGLWQNRWQENYNDFLAVIIRTLIHTISHVLLKHVEWSGFSQNSVGEYLLPGALSLVLYANRYAETKIGGLTTLFEQQLDLWLNDSAQSGRDCVYDPFCLDEGGSCVGCLHREYNCPLFNRELTRAVLYGGPTPSDESGGISGLETILHGYWEKAL